MDSTQPTEGDDLVDSIQPSAIDEVDIEDDDEAIDDDVEVLLVPPIEDPQIIEIEHDGLDGGNENVTNDNEDETAESEGVPQVNTESEGVYQPKNDVEQAPLVGTRRPSRVPDSRFRLQTTNEGYKFSTVEEEVGVCQNNIMCSKYTLTTQEITKIE